MISSNTQTIVDGIPRRNRLDLCEPAELKIYEAMREIELLGASTDLTDAIILLQQAK